MINKLQQTDYNNCLNNREQLTKKQNIFRFEKHKVYTIEINKIALSYNDNKCFIMKNNIDTFTHEHYKIIELQNNISINNNEP